MKQMDRRLLILMRLREETPVRASDLAEECGCSVRTIYRDIDALCQAGVPVAALPGEGYRLAPGYHLPPVSFTADEAVQLLLGAELVRGVGTPEQREAARSAAAKVEGVLRPETRREVERLRERLRVSPWGRGETSPFLPLLQEALLHDRVVLLRYLSFSAGEITERKVEPHFLVYYGNDWHLVGYCRLREAMRDFRAGRIQDVAVLPETFARRPDVGEYDEDDDRSEEVRVWLAAEALPWAREAAVYGFEREERSEGGSVFVFRVRPRDVRRLLPWVLGWGPAARAIAPEHVVSEVRRQAAALVSAYDQE